MDETESKEALVRQIEKLRQQPGFSRSKIFQAIREHFSADEECETFLTTAITRILAEEQIREFEEFTKEGIDLELFWNTKKDDLVCEECRARDGEPGPWDASPPPLHDGCRCWLSMRIKR